MGNGVDSTGTISPVVWWVFGGLLVLSLTVTVVALVDVARHEVRHLPKLGWAAVILLGGFPLGVIVYFVAGRVPRDGAGGPRPGAGGGDVPAAGSGRSAVLAEPGTLAALAAAPAWPPATGTGTILRTHGLGKTYRETEALSGVDLAVPRYSTYGLIGPNGAGKTTLLSILAGLRRPTTGSVELAVPRRRVAVLVDTPQFEPWLTAYEVVDLARQLTAPSAPAARVREALAEAGLADAADRRVGGFSRGMLQRLGLAGCLVGDPELLLLDEPASALDPAGRRDVLDLIGRLAHTKTVLLSTHILADVQQVCDTVAVIDHGRLRYQGSLSDLLARTGAVYLLHVRPPAGDLAAALRGEPWVSELAEPAPGRLKLVVSDPARAERETPRLLAALGVALVSFQPATDLETAFLELTSVPGGAEREPA